MLLAGGSLIGHLVYGGIVGGVTGVLAAQRDAEQLHRHVAATY
jgi:gas vesicle protein